MNCKPGDLAIVVRDLYPENIGRIVRVVKPAKWVMDAPAWACEALGQPLRVMWIDRAPETYLSYEGEAYDSDLKPISGVPVNDEVKDEVTA